MAPGNYAFIDVLVLDGVRERFVAGDALAILSPSLDRIIWANGDGARLFGQDDVAGAAGAPSRLSPAAQRQIRAAPDFPNLARERNVLVRLPHGVAGFTARSIVLPRGEAGILLAAAPGREPLASDLIGGIAQPGHFVALLDGEGEVLAGSEDFHEFDMADDLLQALAELSRSAPERLVKRIVRSSGVELPVGVARISDEPARHLLIAVDEATSRLQDEPDDDHDAAPTDVADDALPRRSVADAAASPGVPAPATEVADTTADAAPAQGPEAAVHDAAPPSPDEPARVVAGDVEQDDAPVVESGATETVAAAEPTSTDASPDTVAPSVDLAAVRSRPPLRFAWKTDSLGRFSAVSPEFATAFGPAGDILGQAFSDVSQRIGIDTDGEIASLLERRDTWSGRMVMWPLADTDLRVPVDLAALPVYARDRSFEGFRGFGVARFADVREAEPPALPPAPDEATTPNSRVENTDVAPADEDTEPTATPGDPFEGEIPALKITPQPSRRSADKVIRLAEHRATETGLTPVERNAFREIGNKLRRTQDDETARILPAPPRAPREAATVEMVPAETESRGVGEEEATTFAATAGADPSSGKPEAMATAAGETPDASVAASPEPIAAPSVSEAGDLQSPPYGTEAATFDIETEPAAAESGPIEAVADDADRNPPGQEDLDPTAAGDDHSLHSGRPLDTSEVAILSRLPVPILIHAGDTLHYANEEFLALTGYSDLAHLEAHGGLGGLFADRYESDMEDGGDHALRLRTADGAMFPIDALLRSVPWNGGHALMLVVRRAGDVPEPPAADSDRVEEMKTHIAELRAMIDTATDGVIVVAPDGTIRSISRPAEALFGHDGDEIAGRPFTDLFAIESQRAARDYLASLSDHGVASVLNDGREVIGREAQGRFIPLFLSMGRLPNDSGYCAVVRDITPWKRAEEELTKARAMAERASSQKSDFLARISHEIRTPLNAIIGFSELMVDERFGPVGNDRYRDYLRDINRSGNHVLDLVNDLLDISKIEAGEQEMTYEAVSLNETLSQTVAMMQPQANRERVIIRSSFASKLPDVVADLRSVRQIALNLLSNAVRYTQAGGQVIVSTAYEPSGDVVMRVRDTGIGMSNAEIDQAMKPFKQISTLRGTRADGTGLGLPLTKAMVEANRARFSIASTPGEGTLVEVTFPATRVLAE